MLIWLLTFFIIITFVVNLQMGSVFQDHSNGLKRAQFGQCFISQTLFQIFKTLQNFNLHNHNPLENVKW
jgi:hypothetical protein